MKTTLAAMLLLLPFVGSAPADTFVVNNVFDPGSGTCDVIGCTLREAIDAANANPGADIINFNIPGAGVQTITLSSSLPSIDDPLTIDGYSQPGASANTLAIGNDAVLLIEVSGDNSFGGLFVEADDCTIRGLVLNRCSGQGIDLGFANAISNALIEGNFIGTNPAGTADLGHGLSGIVVESATDCLIGGTTPGARNLISGNGSAGVLILVLDLVMRFKATISEPTQLERSPWEMKQTA